MPNLTIRFGGYQGAASVHTRAGRVLGQELRRLLGAAVEFTQIDNVTALGRNSTDLFTMVETGELEMCYFASSYLVARVPSLKVLDLPFQVSDRQHMVRCLEGELGRRLTEAVAGATPFAVVGFWDNGFRHFSNRLRPIVHPRDCHGMSIRTMDNALHQDVFRALGMAPRFLDVKDFPAAVAKHEVDAQENPLTNTVNFKVHETHRYVSMTGHFCGTALVLINRTTLQSWSANVQAALLDAMTVATREQRTLAAAEDDSCLRVLTQAGIEVLQPEQIDRPAFIEATAALVARESAALDAQLLGALRG